MQTGQRRKECPAGKPSAKQILAPAEGSSRCQHSSSSSTEEVPYESVSGVETLQGQTTKTQCAEKQRARFRDACCVATSVAASTSASASVLQVVQGETLTVAGDGCSPQRNRGDGNAIGDDSKETVKLGSSPGNKGARSGGIAKGNEQIQPAAVSTRRQVENPTKARYSGRECENRWGRKGRELTIYIQDPAPDEGIRPKSRTQSRR